MRPISKRWVPSLRVGLYLLAFALLVGPLPKMDTASPVGNGKVVLKFSHNLPTLSIPHQAALLFKELVEARTQGYYDVQIFPAQQLGSLRDQVEQAMLGTIEATHQPAAVLSLFVPKIMLLDFPFLWPQDEEVMWKILDGPLGQELLQELEAKSLKGLDIWSSGFKQITTSMKPLRALADFIGLKMRVMPSQLLSAQYEAWGSSPTPVDFKELYTALEQGLVDGHENPAWAILDMKFYEVQKYITESLHGFLHFVIVFHKPWFDSQTPAHQALLVQAIHEAGQWQRQSMRERNTEAMLRLKETGIQVQPLPDETREQLRQRSLQVHKQFAERVGKDYLQRVYTAITQATQ